MVTVDDPRTMESSLQTIYPDAVVKMDVGHVIFSRVGPLLDKTHEQYGECSSR